MKLTMKKWKVAIFSIVLLFIAALSTLLWNVRTPSVIGSAATASDYGLTMENGASIRIVGTSGIRFSASISEEKAANATEYGMILSTAEALNGAELTKENAKRTIKSTAGMNTATEGGNIRFNAVLTNVKDENLTRTYVARAYVTDANGTYYTDAVERTPFGVAVAAYADYKDKPGYDAIKDYIVLDVNIDGEGNVTLAREYATIAGVTISASGTVNVSDPNLSDIIGEGTEFFGLVVNGKRVEMGENSSVVEIGGKDFEFTNVSVSGGTFSGTSTAHTHSYVWNTSAAEVDVKSCTCGAIAETFTKDYTSNRLELVYGKGETTITLPVAVTSPLLDGADESLTVSDTSVDFSSLKDNLQKHGDHTLTGTVTTEDGQEHTVKLAVRLITGDIDRVVTMFNAVFAKDGEEKWGFYRVTKDFDYRNYFINQDCGYNMDSAEDTTARAGFHGTIYGEKADGTRPVITSQQRSNGVFGWLLGATVKDLIIVDEYAAGVHPYSGALLAVVAQSSTISNVEFRLTTAAGYTSDEQENQRKGWIVNRYCAWNTFENVSIVNVSPSVTTFAPLFGTGNSGDYTGMEPNANTFKNCIVSGAEISSLGWQINSTTGEKTIYTLDNTSGITATDHIHNYVLVSDASGHSRRCTVCGATTGRENHSGGTANCEHGKICTVCGTEYTAPSGNHVGGEVNCAHGKICTVCGTEYTAPSGNHVGGEANCAHGKICTVCGVEYTAPSGEHVGPYNWTVGENADEKICTVCGKAVETFTTNYTTRYDVVYNKNETLNLSGYFTNATVSNIAFNGVALSGNIGAISFANVADLKKHGDHELTMTVTVDGQAHTVKFPVRLITGDIDSVVTMFNAVFAKDGEEKWGFYRVTKDFDYRNYFINQDCGYNMDSAEDTTAQKGFHGTIYGEKADGTRPVITSQQRSNGVFGWLIGATVKDLIIVDEYAAGVHPYSGALLAVVAQGSTISNVEFRLTTAAEAYTHVTSDEQANQRKGWIVNRYCAWNTFENVSFVNVSPSVTTFAPLFGTGNSGEWTGMEPNANTFKNCIVSGAEISSLGWQINSTTGVKTTYTLDNTSGITKTDHVHTYTYTGTAEGHVGTCTQCDATTATAAHFGGVATCQSAGKCKLCGYEYIPASVGTHSFDGTTYVSDDEYHYLACKYCGTVDGETAEVHTGGTATCAQGAICGVCGVEYGAVSSTGHEAFAWRTGEHVDEKYCTTCNAVVETFVTDYTATRYDVVYNKNETLDLSDYFTNATVSNIVFNGVALSGDIGAISFANVADLKKHGDHELTMTVTEDGQAHSVKLAVRLITGDIDSVVTMFNAVFAKDGEEKWGFYRVTADFDYRSYFINQDCGYNMDSAEDTTAQKGFHGTIYGEKADGTRPVITSQQRSNGVFGWLLGATVKDLIIVDDYAAGVHPYSGALLAVVAQGSTISNVEFRLKTATEAYTHVTSDEQANQRKGWIVNRYCAWNTFENVSIVNVDSNVTTFAPLFGTGNSGDCTGMEPNTFKNCMVSGAEISSLGWKIDSTTGVKTIYTLDNTSGITSPKNIIVVSNADGKNEPSSYLMEVASDLQGMMDAATKINWVIQKKNAYSSVASYSNVIVLGNVTALSDSATLTAAAKGKGGSSYAMKADGTTLYLCGANDYGIEFAVYEFLEQYFGFERFSPTYYVMNTETWTNESTLDATKIATNYADGVQMAFLNNSYRTVLSGDSIQQMRYSGDIGVEQLMYVKEGDYSSKVHNAFSWLDPATYKGQHASWYAKEEYKNWLGITKTRQAYYELCYTAQGNTSEYNAMIAQCVEVVKTAVALPANANLHYLPFLKNDATSVCVCDACKNLANAHGGNKSATVVKFMNDLMAAIKADTSITRTDFDLVFFAYEGFETAPTGMTLDDRVTVWLAAPYSFNYQASIDDSTNAAGKANLKAWSDMSTSGDLWLWTYSTKFTDFLFPVDTFAFYNETAYNYFKECGVTMVYNQAQDSQTGRLTAWHELKMYLEGQLMQDSTKTQAELIAHYMEKTFGPAAEAMTNFFNGVRTASQADSLKTLYANNKYGAYTLLGNAVILRNNGSCWNKSDIQSWLNYCTQAYAAIDAAKTAGTISDTEYARIKANIDTEWASPAYMYLCFYGAGDGVTKAGLISKINALGITRFSEFNTQGGGLVSSSDPEVSLEAHINGL